MYILDADVFIEAASTYYAFDIAPKFWEILINLADDNQITSIDFVQTELLRGNDELATWIEEEFDSAFASTDDTDVSVHYAEIMNWVNDEDQYFDYAKADFARGADGWIIAYAMAKNLDVVTLERLNPVIKRKVPIPNVCQNFGISFMDTFSMLRNLGVQLNP